ncbi:MAG: redoxin domain-containing protein [Pirellulales bacterium]
MRRFVWTVVGIVALTGCAAETPSPNAGAAAANGNGPSSTTAAPTPGATQPTEPTEVAAPTEGGESASTPASPTEGPLAGVPPQLIELLQTGELDKAVEQLQGLIAKDAKNRQMSMLLIQVLEGQAMQRFQTGEVESAEKSFETAAQAAEKFVAEMSPLTPEEQGTIGTALYNGACVMAKAGKPDEAEKRLLAAFDNGFSDLAQLDKDEDLASLRERDSYKAFRASAEQKIAEGAQRAAGEQLAKFESFPFDFALTDVDDMPRKLEDYKGKVLIVDIWGTWCPPCRMEIPHFVELHKKYKEQGLEIVGINYEEGEPAEVKAAIKKFIEENGMTYTCVVGDDATRDRVPNFEGFPTTLFIDRTGKVRLKEVGYKPLVELEAIVAKLIEEK